MPCFVDIQNEKTNPSIRHFTVTVKWRINDVSIPNMSTDMLGIDLFGGVTMFCHFKPSVIP